MKKKKERTAIPTPTVAPVAAQTEATAEQKLRESLSQQMGGGYEESTPGLQALAELKEKSQQIQKGVTAGEMTPEEAEAQAAEEIEGISGGTTELPIKPSVPKATLGDLYALKNKYKTPRRFTINRYGVVSTE